MVKMSLWDFERGEPEYIKRHDSKVVKYHPDADTTTYNFPQKWEELRNPFPEDDIIVPYPAIFYIIRRTLIDKKNPYSPENIVTYDVYIDQDIAVKEWFKATKEYDILKLKDNTEDQFVFYLSEMSKNSYDFIPVNYNTDEGYIEVFDWKTFLQTEGIIEFRMAPWVMVKIE